MSNNEHKKNIMIIFMSDLKAGVEEKDYKCPTIDERIFDNVKGKQTNEAPIKYVIQKLGTMQSLDTIYYFQTSKVQDIVEANESTEGYLIRMINQYCNQKHYKAPHFVPIPFGADNKSQREGERNNLDQQALSCTFKMVEKIKEDGNIENTSVYVDTTGGFRNATMILVAVMRLLQFCGTQMAQVLYSDIGSKEIIDITATYNMYDFISGANEFKMFGRVDTLSECIQKEEYSSSLKRLVKAMGKFSEGLQLCKAEGFKQDLSTLRQAIKAFKNEVKVTENEKIFDILIMSIEEEYHEIIKEDASIPAIIKWCASKEFMQQALTLYVELIPQYLFEEGIIELVDKEKTKKEIERQYKDYEKKYRRWENDFIFNMGKPYFAYQHKENAEKAGVTLYEYLEKEKGIKLNDVTWKIITTYCEIKKKRNFTHHAEGEGHLIPVHKEKEKIIKAVDVILTLKH